MQVFIEQFIVGSVMYIGRVNDLFKRFLNPLKHDSNASSALSK